MRKTTGQSSTAILTLAALLGFCCLSIAAEPVGQFGQNADIATGEETRLTDTATLDDGPEYSPDGQHIYFNSNRTGTMQLWRMNADGSNEVQLTFDRYNDWFPHISPDGQGTINVPSWSPDGKKIAFISNTQWPDE